MSGNESLQPPCWPSGRFSVVYADPPWSYRGRKQFGFAGDVGVDSGGAVMHYQTMPVADICALPVADICEKDAILFLWIPSPLLPDGLAVASAWGFQYGTVAFVWHKQRTNPGYYTLSECELCFVFKRGRIPTPRSRKQRQFVSELRQRHSAKPHEVRNRISGMFPTQEKVELFYRGAPPDGWTVWGNEVEANGADQRGASPASGEAPAESALLGGAAPTCDADGIRATERALRPLSAEAHGRAVARTVQPLVGSPDGAE